MSGIRDAVDAAVADVEEPTEEFDTLAYHDDAEAPPRAAPGSALSLLRARAAQLARETTIDLPIPGYGGRLIARYKAVAISAAYADITVRDQRNPINDPGVAADTLARALEGLYGVNEAGELEPLQHDVPTRFDDELVDMLGLAPEARNARSVLVALCGGGDFGRSRVWAHFMEYQGWLMATDDTPAREVAARAVGESRPG